MEGTSGAADRALLRGRACEAALSCESPRQRVPGRADARASGQRGIFVPGGQTNSRRRRRLRAADRHEGATRGVRADRVGAKLSPRAIVVEGAKRETQTVSDWPLTRQTSTGRPRKWNGHPQPTSSPKGVLGGLGRKPRAPRRLGRKPQARGREAKLHQRATAGVVLRSSGCRGRARGSHRLQKSTGGARPISPMCEERVEHEVWSSLAARER